MKLPLCLLLGVNWQQGLQQLTKGGMAGGMSTMEQESAAVLELLETARRVGPVGSLASDDDRQMMDTLASMVVPFSTNRPARYPLVGVHNLVYSAAPGASSGRIFANVVGKVSQFFETENYFLNRVEFGPLQIALRARREIINDSTIKVSFLETSFNLFGKTVSKKEAGGGGVWRVKYVGKIAGIDGKEKLVRIMETPSLFVLEQELV